MGRIKKRTNEAMTLVAEVLQSHGHAVQLTDNPDAVHPKGRKQKRREKKLLKKQNKQRHFQRLANHSTGQEEAKIKSGVEETSPPVVKKPKLENLEKKKKDEKKKKLLEKDNAYDDKIISTLEKKFHMNKRKKSKKLPKSFVDSGLDYVLNALNGGGSPIEDSDDPDSSECFFNDKKMEDDISEASDHEEIEDSDSDIQLDDDQEVSDSEDTRCIAGGDLELSEEVTQSETEDEALSSTVANKDESQLGVKYTPPAMRVKFTSEQEQQIQKLKRKTKGLINRLSSANMNSICNELETMYREKSKAIMNKVLCGVIMDQFVSPDPVPSSLVLETAMLIAVISVRVAIEVLMHFYEIISLKIYSLLTETNETQIHGKSLNNLLTLLCRLYQLKSIDHKVIVDFMGMLINSFTEKHVELMLEVLTNVGFLVRKDDPEAFQGMVKNVSSKCSDLNISLDDGSRMSYMLGILVAVKNNNVKKVTGYDPDFILAQRKKVSMLIKTSAEKSQADTMPTVTLENFLTAETNGRWWIVGSSFAGRPMLRESKQEQAHDEDYAVPDKVSKAAKAQRMNTEVRRKIFHAVMSADDFVDAFQRVIKCGLKGKQLREIAVVVVDCCQQEKKFNQFYVHLLNRFCQHDRLFVISLQCTLWDRFKLIPSLKESQRSNIMELTAQLILMEAVPLTCLKGVDFAGMDAVLVKFLQGLLSCLATNTKGPEHLQSIFDRASCNSKNKLVCQGLSLFLRHFLLSDATFMEENSQLRDSFIVMLKSLGRKINTFL